MRTGGDLPTRVAEEIRKYLTQCPDGGDTDRHIQRWWLPPWCEVPIEVVRDALQLLEEEGFVKSEAVIGGGTIYRRKSNSAPKEADR
jgi:hypothetical protein